MWLKAGIFRVATLSLCLLLSNVRAHDAEPSPTAEALRDTAPPTSAPDPLLSTDFLPSTAELDWPAGGTSAREPVGAAQFNPAQGTGVAQPDVLDGSDEPQVDNNQTSAAEAPPGYDVMPGDTAEAAAACVACQSADLLDGEPVCANGYVDSYNGGCNSTPNVVGQIECGQTVCGTYGTFLSPGGSNFRDTDWYQFTLPQAADVTWTAVGDAPTRVFIMRGSCPASTLSTGVADACRPASASITNLAAGTYYVLVATDAFSGVPCGSRYRATLTVTPCCVGACRSEDVVEDEQLCANGYVDNFNGGCNSTPNVVGHIDCGETVCGTYGTFLSPSGSNFRDTDWYQFTLPQPADVTWTAVGEARTRVFLLRGQCPASSLATAVADACQPASVTVANLAAGTYYAFVGTDAFSGVPCGLSYRATLTVTPCCVGPGEFDDLTEGEPVCANGQVDNYNGGCNSTPNIFGATDCGLTVRGTYGTFLNPQGSNFRDTDWYHFTITQPSDITWTAVGEARTRVFVLQGTCPASSLATGVADACQPATVSLTNLAPGTYSAFVGTDAFSGVPCGLRYRAALTVDPCCSVGRRPGDAIEGEEICADGYADAFDGGCNSSPPIFNGIRCAQSVSGTYGTFLSAQGASFRDTDWYQFTLRQPTTVTWTAVGEARTRVFILQGTCPASSLGTEAANACEPATVTLDLEPGTYSAFVGTDSFGGVECGSRYRATLDTIPCVNLGDIDGDGEIDLRDLMHFAGCLKGPGVAYPAGCRNADMDGDGDVDLPDAAQFTLLFTGQLP